MAPNFPASLLAVCENDPEIRKVLCTEEASVLLAHTIKDYAIRHCMCAETPGRYLLFAILDTVDWIMLADALKSRADGKGKKPRLYLDESGMALRLN